ncbi:UNVERIFIED_CONTAM: hypothetical protein K2H54_019774 [Gekko kuhli]
MVCMGIGKSPDQISLSEFMSKIKDYKSPTASSFTAQLVQCQSTVVAIEEVNEGEQPSLAQSHHSCRLACRR